MSRSTAPVRYSAVVTFTRVSPPRPIRADWASFRENVTQLRDFHATAGAQMRSGWTDEGEDDDHDERTGSRARGGGCAKSEHHSRARARDRVRPRGGRRPHTARGSSRRADDLGGAARQLGAVLDAIPGPALLVTAEGGLVASNAHARQWLESAGAREEALRAARWRRSTADLALTAIDGASGVVLLVRPPGDPSDAPAATSPSDWHLTPREQDILSLLVDGRSNRTIAAALDVGERTVETHLSAMFGKAGVASRAELVARARRA